MEQASWQDLRKLRGMANYQFGRNIGDILFSGNVQLIRSKRTGRIRQIFRDAKLVAAIRPSDGRIALSLAGAALILKRVKEPPNLVVVSDEAAEHVRSGKSVFCKHVIMASSGIRPADEVIVVDGNRKLLAVGRASLSGEEVLAFKKGIAVKVRHGAGHEEGP